MNLSPLNRRRFERFKANKRGWWSLWLFLVLFGSLLAYTIYLRLLRDWGPVRAGSYAFISPVIAVLVGIGVLHEQVSLLDVLGMAAMLTGAWLCASAPSDSAGPAFIRRRTA